MNIRRTPISYHRIAPGLPFHAAYVPIRATEPTLHRHQDFAEMFLVVAGAGRHWRRGGSHPLSRGDLGRVP